MSYGADPYGTVPRGATGAAAVVAAVVNFFKQSFNLMFR
jgi:hypothetical protein